MTNDVIRFVFIKDPHFDLIGSPNRKDNYLQALFFKFDQIAAICRKLDAKALLIGGDVFLKTEPSRIPYKLVTEMLQYFNNFPVPIAGIIGNHDARMGLEHYEKYPISVLIKSGAYRYLDENPLVVKTDTFSVKVGGVSYQKDAYDKILSYEKTTEDFLVLLGHFFIAENAGNFYNERIFGVQEFASASFDVLAVGHEHVNKGIYTYDSKYFVNSGQISRVSSSKEDRELVPTIVVFSISKETGIKFKEIKLSYASAKDIFGEEREYVWQEDVVNWDDFVDKLDSLLDTNSLIDLNMLINQTDFSDAVKERAKHYVFKD